MLYVQGGNHFTVRLRSLHVATQSSARPRASRRKFEIQSSRPGPGHEAHATQLSFASNGCINLLPAVGVQALRRTLLRMADRQPNGHLFAFRGRKNSASHASAPIEPHMARLET